MRKHTTQGFTLIELLVVIAIIGILASIIIASLASAKVRARDAQRLDSIKEMRNALTLYYNDNQESYPSTLSQLVPTFLPSLPVDPLTGAQYQYAGLIVDDTTCQEYHLGIALEQNISNGPLASDTDAAAATECTGSAVDFSGTDPVYDVKS